MFGDYFGQRGDYSTGVFYAGHRKYLNPGGISSFEAPVEFKSKKEYRYMKMSRERSSEQQDDIKFNGVKFQHNKGVELQKFKHAVTVVKNVISLEGGTLSVNKDEWIEEFKAGVKYWVNKETGEVSATCPWKDPVDGAVKRFLNFKAKKIHQELVPNNEYGTGSLVYDRAEVDDLFRLLDTKK